MSGGLSGSATSGIFNDLQFLNYPRAAASAVILFIVVLLIAGRDFPAGRRAQGTGEIAMAAAPLLRLAALDVLCAGDAVHAVRHLPLRADDRDPGAVVPGAVGIAGVSAARSVAACGSTSCSTQRRTGDVVGAFDRSLPLAVIVMILTVLISVTAGFAFRRRFRGADRDLLHGDRQPDRAGPGAVDRHPGDVPLSRLHGELVRFRHSARICPGRCPSGC